VTKSEKVVYAKLLNKLARKLGKNKAVIYGSEVRDYLRTHSGTELEKYCKEQLKLNHVPWEFDDRWNRYLKYVKNVDRSANGRFIIFL
jgi:hypothetical protein